MRPDARRTESNRRPFPIHASIYVAYSNRLSQGRTQAGSPTRRNLAPGRNGRYAKTRNCSACLGRVIRGRLRQKPYNSGGCARGSRSFEPAVLGTVTNGPPSIGVALVKATSGISLGNPSRGKSFRNGKN